MAKLGDVPVAKVLWISGAAFALMTLWTWYMSTTS